MPNKTIYVSDDDLTLYARAQELAGGNLSSAISTAIRRYIDIEGGKEAGFQEVTVWVGVEKQRRRLRFSGMLLGIWQHYVKNHEERFQVYLSRKGKIVLYTERSEEWIRTSEREGESRMRGIGAMLGLTNDTWANIAAESTFEIFGTVEDLRGKLPDQFYQSVLAAANSPVIEDLDI